MKNEYADVIREVTKACEEIAANKLAEQAKQHEAEINALNDKISNLTKKFELFREEIAVLKEENAILDTQRRSKSCVE